MNKLAPYLWLIFIGTGWGLVLPLTKIATSTGYDHFGIIFWQLAVGGAFLLLLLMIQGRGFPINKQVLPFYIVIAFVGTLIPSTAQLQAIEVLPAGVMSLLMSLIPMIAFPIALFLGLDRFSWIRLAGLAFGLTAVLLLLDQSGDEASSIVWWAVLLGVIPPICYGFEGNFVARWGTGGADPLQLLCGASCLGAIIVLPVALGAGHWINPFVPWGKAEWAILEFSMLHALVYSGYVMLIGRFGSVFSVQVSYVVTLTSIGWAMLLLRESYNGLIWLALGLILIGMYLVAPKPKE